MIIRLIILGLLCVAIWSAVNFNFSLKNSEVEISPIHPAVAASQNEPRDNNRSTSPPVNDSPRLVLVHSIARPLLTPTRRPFVKPPPKPIVEPAPEPVVLEPVIPEPIQPVTKVVVEEKPVPPILELLGVSLSPEKSAAMVRTDSGETLWLAVGENYLGWRVVSIDSNELKLSQSAETALYEIFPNRAETEN